MFIIESYVWAVIFCVITMLCWGSWANTQKLAGKFWRFELFYWDYVIGIFMFSLISALTLGSMGDQGRSFFKDLSQASFSNIMSAFSGGIIFNAANILFSAAIALAGIAVAFPISIGLALVLGVLLNYQVSQKGNSLYLFAGVAFVLLAILLNAKAYSTSSRSSGKLSRKAVLLCLIAGVLMSFFYRFVAASMDLINIENPASGKMTAYTAVFVFSSGILLSNFLFNSLMMRKPVQGPPVTYRQYFSGTFRIHLVGVLGGFIWGLGNSLNLIAAGKAGPAISYGLGQGATLVAACWGVFIWKEFKGAPRVALKYLGWMFFFFLAGLGLVIYAGA